MGLFEDAAAELARRAGGGIFAAAEAELARRQNSENVIGTFADNGRVIQNADGSLQAVSAGGATTDQATIERIMAGDSFAAVVQDSVEQQRIAENPIASRANEFVRGTPFVGSYIDEAVGLFSTDARDNMRASTQAMQNQNPGQTAALNIGGGIAGSIPMAIAAAPAVVARAAPTIGGRALQAAGLGAVTGGVEGAVYGAGEGDTAAGRGSAALQGGAIGLGAGAVLGGAAPYIAQGARSIIGRLRGSDVSTIAQTLQISRPAAIVVRDALQSGDANAAMQAVQRAGGDAMLADAGVPARQLLDAVSQAGGGAAAITRDAVGARTRAASDDIVRVLDDVLGVPQGENEIITAIRTGSAPARNAAYDAAYAVPIDYAAPQGRALESLYGRIPASAWRRADALMQLDGDQSMQRLMQIAPDGTVTLSALPDVRQLDYITRALNDVAAEADGQGKLGGTTDLGRATGALSRQIRQVLRRAVPEYGTALDTAADAISQRNAVETGYNLLATRIRREDVAEALHGASQAERAAARQGLRAYLDDTMAAVTRTIADPDTTTREGIAALRNLSSRANVTKIRMLLGARDADRLLAEIDRAATAFELRSAIADNSRTAVRTSIQAGVDAVGNGNMLNTLAAGEPVNATKRLIQALTGNDAAAAQLRRMGLYEEIARALTGARGPNAQSALAVIQRAIAGQAQLSQAQAQRVARGLISGAVSLERTAAVLADDRGGTRPQ